MSETIFFRKMQRDEADQVSGLVMDGFMDTVAHGCSNASIATFSRNIDPELILDRLGDDHFVLVALNKDHICAMIEVRDNHHISLFYVEKLYQNLGIGRALFNEALDAIEESDPDINTIDVFSSRNAVSFFEKLGFTKTDEEQTENDLKYVPMVLSSIR